MRGEIIKSPPKVLGDLKPFILLRFAVHSWCMSSNAGSFSVSRWKQNAVFVLLPTGTPDYYNATESASFRLSVSSQSNSISVGFSITPSRDLSLSTKASRITELSSQGGFLASSFSSFGTQNAPLLTSKSIILPAFVTEFTLKGQQ